MVGPLADRTGSAVLAGCNFCPYLSTFSSFPPLRLLEQRIVPELKVLFSREQIAARVAELGQQISKDFAGEPVVLVGVLKGAAIFLSDLARHIELDSTFDFIAVSSYGDQKQNSGEVKLLKDVDQSMEGKNVILVEDILDTGLTMSLPEKDDPGTPSQDFQNRRPAGQKVPPFAAHPSRLHGI